eukprot:767137-Hanusia_phi.AAC.5
MTICHPMPELPPVAFAFSSPPLPRTVLVASSHTSPTPFGINIALYCPHLLPPLNRFSIPSFSNHQITQMSSRKTESGCLQATLRARWEQEWGGRPKRKMEQTAFLDCSRHVGEKIEISLKEKLAINHHCSRMSMEESLKVLSCCHEITRRRRDWTGSPRRSEML